MQSEVILKLEHLDIGYQRALVKDICAELKLGEVCLLMGNNGQGKTTLIKSILGENKLLNGDILLAEKSIKPYLRSKLLKDFSCLFQSNYSEWIYSKRPRKFRKVHTLPLLFFS